MPAQRRPCARGRGPGTGPRTDCHGCPVRSGDESRGWALAAARVQRRRRRDRLGGHEPAGQPCGKFVSDCHMRSHCHSLAARGGRPLLRRYDAGRADAGPGHHSGDGWSRGAAIADMEFMQFHPTVLVGSRLLLTEALRGDGAKLLDENGERFVDELAPRDEVSRALVRKGRVFLDLRSIDRGRFPGLMAEIEKSGFDPALQPVPVSPAAHYTIGGIVTDLIGRTDIAGLYAAGECAATGVHGANRLASNSLLECLVFGRRAALAAVDESPLPASVDNIAGFSGLPLPPERVASDSLREQVWHQAGVMRDPAELG